MRQIVYIIFTFILLLNHIFAQACCTAGTPLLGSLEMTSAPKGFLQFALTANHNSLSDVLSGTNFIDDQERERVSQSLLFEVNYGLRNNLSITTLFSFNRQIRTITTIDNKKDELTVSGLGDVMLMLKYSLITNNIFDKQELTFGSGLKFPVGSSNVESNGILLPADMQPGSGSWDYIFWLYYSKGEIIIPQITFFSNLSYRLNGNNKRFGNNNAGYKFGSEFLSTIGLVYNLSNSFEFSMLVQIRNTSQDEFDNSNIPNTGGTWSYIIPGFNYNFGNNISVRLSGDLPIYRNVTGTQLTTTFSTSLSFYYTINLRQGSF